MSSIWGAYLEDFNLIKLIIPTNLSYDHLFLENSLAKQELTIINVDTYSNERYLYLRYDEPIKLNLDYYVYINKEYTYHLSLGKITRSPLFEEQFYYDGPLGIEYHMTHTIFRIWSPVAKEIKLILDDEEYNLKYKEKGLWELVIHKDLDKAKYHYLVRINDKFEKCLDPYGIASDANNQNNYVIDLNKTIQIPNSYLPSIIKPIIYEASLRDMCGNIQDNESAYLKAMDYLEYIHSLGITHLQLMPTFCFGGVNELIKDNKNSKYLYNWGYNPIQYNIPSGWFSSDANNPYHRINEFKTFINKCKILNIGINLDVVYNHVYQYETFSLGILVPGYVYRTNSDGFLMNSSYCGNDLRTEAKMIRKFIVDNLMYLQKEYKIDGFRFDLMGLIDNETMLTIKNKLQKVNPNVMLYGEGWYMSTTLKHDQNANLSSSKILYPIAFFNDYFRNEISGSLQGLAGFVHGKAISSDELDDLINHGSMKIMPFKDYNQSINYIECHDNLTFYDKTKSITKQDDDHIIPYLKLGIAIVILSRGISFIHAGEELCRSKKGEHNSYNKNDDFNHIPWENRHTKFDLSEYLRSIIEINKKLIDINRFRVYQKDNYYEIRYGSKYQVIISNNFEEKTIYFSPDTTLIFNGKIIEEKCEKIIANTPGLWVLEK